MKKAIKKVNKTKTIETKEISELRKLAYIFGSIIIIFVLFYSIAYLKTVKKPLENVVSEFQHEKILASNILKQSEEKYYIMIYNDTEEYGNLYDPYIKNYAAKKDSSPLYYVDMNNTFNISYKSDTNNLNLTDISELKVKDNILLIIENSKIVKHYINEGIIEFLKK